MGDSQVDPSVIKIFGDVKRDLIDKEWTRRRYIEMTKVQDCDPDNPQFEYRWGERATIEFEKKDILKFVAKVIFFGLFTNTFIKNNNKKSFYFRFMINLSMHFVINTKRLYVMKV